MDDFGRFVYLDVQKTGSSFISHFLEQRSKSERVKFKKHGRIEDDYRPDAFYFISVRNPIDQYISLYQFGCEKKGGLFFELRNIGLEGLYENSSEGFAKWLDFVLSSKNAGLVGKDYGSVDTDLIGFQSFRFLVLSFQHPLARLGTIKTYRQLLKLYQSEKIHDHIIRNENLNADLRDLAEHRLQDHFEAGAVDAFVAETGRVNYSQKLDLDLRAVSDSTMSKFLFKERFLLENFYPDTIPDLERGRFSVRLRRFFTR